MMVADPEQIKKDNPPTECITLCQSYAVTSRTALYIILMTHTAAMHDVMFIEHTVHDIIRLVHMSNKTNYDWLWVCCYFIIHPLPVLQKQNTRTTICMQIDSHTMHFGPCAVSDVIIETGPHGPV